MSKLDYQTIGLDWTMNPTEVREIVGPNKTLQGNLDPCALYADKATIQKHTRRMLEQFGSGRHIANLGHGVYPDINPDHVKYFIEAVKEFSIK